MFSIGQQLQLQHSILLSCALFDTVTETDNDREEIDKKKKKQVGVVLCRNNVNKRGTALTQQKRRHFFNKL